MPKPRRIRPSLTVDQATILYTAANMLYSDPEEFTDQERRDLGVALRIVESAILRAGTEAVPRPYGYQKRREP